MSKSFKLELLEYLRRHGHELVGWTEVPTAVEVIQRGSANIASLNGAGLDATIVVKNLGRRWQSRGGQEFCRINAALRARSSVLREALSPIQLTGPENKWIALEYYQGVTLDRYLSTVATMTPEVEKTLTTLGRLVATLHRVPAECIGYSSNHRPNRKFRQELEQAWKGGLVASLLPRGWRSPVQLYERVSSDFWMREPAQVFMSDFQPKNVIVKSSGDLILIDPDFSVGNPAVPIGFFLNGMNQLAFDHRSWLRPKMVSSCKRVFLEAYFAHAHSWIADDLIFFYPWTIAEASSWRALRSRFPKPAMKILGSIFMSRYLRRLDQLHKRNNVRAQASLFAG